jgi:hypothetical protein
MNTGFIVEAPVSDDALIWNLAGSPENLLLDVMALFRRASRVVLIWALPLGVCGRLTALLALHNRWP